MKTITTLLISIWLFAFCTHSMAQQTAQQIQDQMNAADAPQSAANTVTYKTPLKTYQAYYSKWTTGSAKALFDCYTSALQQNELDGNPYPTDDQFNQIGNQILQDGYSNFQVTYFIFASDPQRPTVTVTITSTDSQHQLRKEQLVMTMLDTAAGWKIDVLTATELN